MRGLGKDRCIFRYRVAYGKRQLPMPLLVREETIYPERLLLDSAPYSENGARWWVLHCRPRAEKSVARKLLRARVGFFLPLYEKRWGNKTRHFQSHPPLFPGYVFLFGDREACAL